MDLYPFSIELPPCQSLLTCLLLDILVLHFLSISNYKRIIEIYVVEKIQIIQNTIKI